MEDLITPQQAAEILGVSRQLVQYHCGKGHIRCRKVGRLFLILRKDVMQYMQYTQSLGRAKAPSTVRNDRTGKHVAKQVRTRLAQSQTPLRAPKKELPKQ